MPDDANTKQAQPVRKRLFIGGLHRDVTAGDLQQRFGRFGSVTAIDVRTKRDSQGQIVNVFAHMDIEISETNFKKCSSIFNDAKWKGHTMKVQVAKEDFLAKLANERKEAKANAQPVRPKTRKKTDQEAAIERLEENLKNAGVEDFLMKKAVPGTPIPGETNWIVGKFGRVLPIMHLPRKDRRSRMTHDPSKYVHHLRKFKDDTETDRVMTDSPVEGLTWRLPEDISEMDRKRMGEFPESARKKLKQEDRDIVSQKKIAPLRSQDGEQSSIEKSKPSDQDFEIVRLNGKTDGGRADLARLKPYRALTEANVKSNQSNKHGQRDVQDLLEQCSLVSDGDSCGSADTDEICHFAKRDPKPEREALTNWAEDYHCKERAAAMSGDASDASEYDGFRKEDSVQRNDILTSNDSNGPKWENLQDQIADCSDDTAGDVDEGEFEDGEDVEESDDVSEEDGDEDDKSDKEYDQEHDSNNEADIDGAHSNEDDEDDNNENDGEDDDLQNSEDEEENSKAEDNSKEATSHVQHSAKDTRSLKGKHDVVPHTTKQKAELGTEATNQESVKKETSDAESSSSQDEGDASDDDEQSSCDITTSSSGDSDGTETPGRAPSVDNADLEVRKATPGSLEDATKHRQSNQIRLESVKKRQASIQTQKAAIQDALKSLDSQKGSLSARTHVRFDSDDDSSDANAMPKDTIATSKVSIVTRPGLFDSEDEETMELGDEANDDDRFQIKPQFQGKAGEKLLKLQDRIGTDSRFKLGEMFMEDEADSDDDDLGDDDQALKAEKQQSLAVLESIVGRQAVHSLDNKTTANFRDPSRMRYDPTSKDHARFEITDSTVSTGTSTGKKDKSRDDAPIPEVSKETFYEVRDLEFSQDKDDSKPFRFFAEEASESENEDVEGLNTLHKDIQASTALGKRQLTLDSSESESEAEEAKHDGKDDMDIMHAADTTGSNQPTSAYQSFFFQPDDVRLKTGPEQFCRKLSVERMNQWLEEQKAGLQGEFKKRHQRALRDAKKAAQRGSSRKPRR